MFNNIQHEYFEITIVDEPIEIIEHIYLLSEAKRAGLEVTISESNRIILISGTKDINIIARYLATVGFDESVGLIKHVVEYWPHINFEELLDE